MLTREAQNGPAAESSYPTPNLQPRCPDLRGRPLSSGGRTVTQTLGAERSIWAAASGPSLGSVWPQTRSRRAPGRSPVVSANVKRSTCVMKPSASTSKPRRPWPSLGSASSLVSQPRLTSCKERLGESGPFGGVASQRPRPGLDRLNAAGWWSPSDPPDSGVFELVTLRLEVTCASPFSPPHHSSLTEFPISSAPDAHRTRGGTRLSFKKTLAHLQTCHDFAHGLPWGPVEPQRDRLPAPVVQIKLVL